MLFLKDCLKFIEIISEAVPLINNILIGEWQPEILEAIEFVVTARNFDLNGVDEAVWNMLTLVFSKEKTVKDAVVSAFKTLYLRDDEHNPRAVAIHIAQRLIILLKSLSYIQRDALEELVKESVVSGTIDQYCIQVLWEIYSRKLQNASAEDSRAAICLLHMISSGKIQVVQSNIDVLIKHGLGLENRNDHLLVKYTCKIFYKLARLKNDPNILIRYPADHELFQNLVSIITQQFTDLDNIHYAEIAMDAISIIFELSDLPDTTCQLLLKNMYKEVSSRGQGGRVSIEEELVARLCLLTGHTAYSYWKYLEEGIYSEIRRRNSVFYAQKKSNNSKRNSKKNEDEELCQNDMTAEADHKASERIRYVCENEILSERNVLGALSSLIVKICENPGMYTSDRVRSAAAIGLSKLMLISSDFCESHIRLFFTMMEKSTDPEVRIDLLLAFGDLCYRFPNNVEPWTYLLYERMNDSCLEVRHTALIVISFLISNEMIKAKAHISEVALCLDEKEPKIRNLATQLFNDLSQKGNTINNIIPDIISRLSNPGPNRIPEEKFQLILKKLMSLVVKEKLYESLVESLCHRFRGTRDEVQCNEIAYCLSLIPFSDRALQKLLENISCYADRLQDPQFNKYFVTIINNFKKSKIGKGQEIVDELEQKIDKIIEGGEEAVDDVLTSLKTPAKTPCKTPYRSRRTNQTPSTKLRQKAEKLEEFTLEEGTPVRRTRITAQSDKEAIVANGHKDYDSIDTVGRSARTRRVRKNLAISSDSESN